MEPANQAPPASSEIVKLIRKLRWVGLEEKAQQLEKELERHAVTDTVVSTQSETANTNEVLGWPFVETARHVAISRLASQAFREWRALGTHSSVPRGCMPINA